MGIALFGNRVVRTATLLLAVATAGLAAVSAAPFLVWRNVGPGGGGWIQSVTLDPRAPETIHVGCDVGGYYQSTDGGRTFRICNTGLSDPFVQAIAVDPADPAVLYLATESGVFKSSNAGASWQLKRNGFPPTAEYSFSAPVGALVLDPSNPRVIYAGVGRPRQCTAGRGRHLATPRKGPGGSGRYRPCRVRPEDAGLGLVL